LKHQSTKSVYHDALKFIGFRMRLRWWVRKTDIL